MRRWPAGLSPVHPGRCGVLRPERWTAVAHAVYAKAKEGGRCQRQQHDRTSMVARSLVPGAPVAHALLVARRPRTGCACRLTQSHSGDDGAWSFSSRGISSSLANFVNIANIANIALRGSQACSECSILSRTRSWRAGRLISQLRSSDPSKSGAVVLTAGDQATGGSGVRDGHRSAPRGAARCSSGYPARSWSATSSPRHQASGPSAALSRDNQIISVLRCCTAAWGLAP